MHKADNLPPSCAVVMKSGNLNFLEPFESLQACNGITLPLPLPLQVSIFLCRHQAVTHLSLAKLHNRFQLFNFVNYFYHLNIKILCRVCNNFKSIRRYNLSCNPRVCVWPYIESLLYVVTVLVCCIGY